MYIIYESDASLKIKTVSYYQKDNAPYIIEAGIIPISIIPYINWKSEYRSIEFYYVPAEGEYRFRVFDINLNGTISYPSEEVYAIIIYYNKDWRFY